MMESSRNTGVPHSRPMLLSRQSSRESLSATVRESLFDAADCLERDLLDLKSDTATDTRSDDEDGCSIMSELRQLDSFEGSVRDELDQVDNIWRFSERSCMPQLYIKEPSVVSDLECDDSPDLLSLSTDSLESIHSLSSLDCFDTCYEGVSFPSYLFPSLHRSNLTLALASDILATKLYLRQSTILPVWLKKVFSHRQFRAPATMLLGVPLIGSASGESGNVMLMGDISRPTYSTDDDDFSDCDMD
jgi:hypothetical protein